MIPKVHVHVYKVTAKAEVEFDHANEASLEQRRAKALEMAKAGKIPFQKSDCEFIALGFYGDG